jgi:hypothetical protein
MKLPHSPVTRTNKHPVRVKSTTLRTCAIKYCYCRLFMKKLFFICTFTSDFSLTFITPQRIENISNCIVVKVVDCRYRRSITPKTIVFGFVCHAINYILNKVYTFVIIIDSFMTQLHFCGRD